MGASEKIWKTVTRSQFPWEQEALDFIYERFPAQDNYRAWANFEFQADDGSINEVDLLVACPQGIFLIEIKSRPGDLRGDARDWIWEHEGRKRTDENPVILANRKCKRLKSLLARQKALKKESLPFIEPLVFVSHAEVTCHLSGNAAFNVCLRDKEGLDGIMAAIRRRECPGLKVMYQSAMDRPRIKALSAALEQAGIRPSQSARKVGDFLLQELLFDSPLGTYQDWSARHVTVESTQRVARIYMVARQSTEEERETIHRLALREFQLLERLDHPGILKADPPSDCEFGPVLFYRQSREGIRLDHFLTLEKNSLPVDVRLDLLRQVGEILRYAHGQGIIHRSLSPQSIFVSRNPEGRPVVQMTNWITGARLITDSSASSRTQLSRTLHAGQLIEDDSQVYIAPEALLGNADGGVELDCFSLGALTYLLFTGQAPAASVTELQSKLKDSLSGGLDIREAMDGAVDSLVEIVRGLANGTASDRSSVEDFLTALDLIEDELTQPESQTVLSPLEARKGDELEGGYVVQGRLGSGSISVVFLVEREGRQQVLKLARSSQYNSRIRDEYLTLREVQDKVRTRIVVAPFELLEFGDIVGFTMERAGEKTLARFLREEGALDLTYLQRFGDDLLRTIRDLDEAGIVHRDLKPENMGLRIPSKKQYQLCLFDFSLSKASPEDIRAGTLAYMDPFIGERKVKRWDISSECFSAAMTLHEMATGVLPVWGDGRSDPASVKGEAQIQPERFDPDLRDRFVPFFRKALSRDFRQRFDNPSEMLKAWNDIFATVDHRKATRTHHPEEEGEEGAIEFELPALLTPATQLVLLGLTTRLLNTLDRLNLVTVADLLGYPLRKILHLRGVGNKTRRELGELVRSLRERLPDVEMDPVKAMEAALQDEDESPDAVASVDLIARQVAVSGRGRNPSAEQEVLQAFLGWKKAEKGWGWISQSDLAQGLGVSRQRVGQAVSEGRERWKRYPAITSLRETLNEILSSVGGVMTQEELVSAVLAARGSAFEEPERSRMASVATRAALETERGMKDPRFHEYRSGNCLLVALSPELKAYALALGQAADRLAGQDPIPSPTTVLSVLQRVPAPDFPEDVVPPSDQRLCQLAVAVSEMAALSSRMEVYPVGLEASRALRLAQNALFGGNLTVEEVQNRVAARFPRAESLPPRPALDGLMDALGLDLKWDPQAVEGKGAYVSPLAESTSVNTSETLTRRLVTRTSLAPVSAVVAPEVAEAQGIEEKLHYASRYGAYLAISVPPGLEDRAREEIERRFPVAPCDLDEAFIQEMQEQARKAGASWDVVLRADGAPRDSADWKNLQMLVERCLPALSQRLRDPNQTRLLLHPGLLARYDRLDLLAGMASEVGRSDGIFGLWVLVPASDKQARPVLNQRAVPLSNPAQHVHLNRAWLANKHRA